MRIRAVDRGGAAESAGLEVGDLIVTVAGYQVGRVGGRVYTLENELQRQADAAGRVRLLLQNRRNNQLTNVEVRLQRGQAGGGSGGGGGGGDAIVRGLAIAPSDARLPRDAQLRVRLVRRALLGAKTYAESTQPLRGAGPAPFELRFDLQQLDRDKDYELEVEILSLGRALYVQNGVYPVRIDRPPPAMEVRLRRA